MLQVPLQSCRENVDVDSRTNLRPHFQTRREGEAHEQIIVGVDYNFVLKMHDVLNWAHFGVVVEGWS